MPKPLAGHSALRRNRVSIPGHVYHLTTATLAREPYFRDFYAARAAIRALNDPATMQGTRALAWVLMPDHLHVLVQLGQADDLTSLMTRIKSASGRAVNRYLGRDGALWQRAYHDHVLRAEDDVRVVARYVVMNPLRAGLVARISEYPHWNAVWL